MTSDSILSEVARLLGIKGLSFDDDGFCVCSLNDAQSVIFRQEGHAGITVFAELPIEISENDLSYLVQALSFNFHRASSQEAILCLDADSNSLVLVDHFPRSLREETVDQWFSKFMEFYEVSSGEVSLQTAVSFLEQQVSAADSTP